MQRVEARLAQGSAHPLRPRREHLSDTIQYSQHAIFAGLLVQPGHRQDQHLRLDLAHKIKRPHLGQAVTLYPPSQQPSSVLKIDPQPQHDGQDAHFDGAGHGPNALTTADPSPRALHFTFCTPHYAPEWVGHDHQSCWPNALRNFHSSQNAE